ncbi:MAG: hypothetical protein ABI723_08790 [Bacteroidia bacterium]
MMKAKSNLVIIFVFMLCACTHNREKYKSEISKETNWQNDFNKYLPLLGHRNWIIIADAAFPLQTAPGINTIYCNQPQAEVLKQVMQQLKKSKHVKPVVYTDKELDYITEKQATGIIAYRNNLKALIGNDPQMILHDSVFSKLSDASKLFNVLVLKTDLTIPYSSVFIQLECGYWNTESENALRNSMKETSPAK